MSGRSYNYAFTHVNDFIAELDAHKYRECETRAERLAFKELLELVSEAMRMIEWEDSGDTGPKQTREAVWACFEYVRDKVLPKQ